MPEHADQGLIDYYSAQADSMLVQYRNINHLLGPTDDWTAPGTHCEILLRDMIRRSIPSNLSVDKGFIYGRDLGADHPTHSPEIDVLIHDTSNYRPIFRLEDFVIVEPSAVKAVIQVKRALDAGTLAKGLKNVLDASKHYKKYRVSGVNTSTYFSALVGFEDKLGLRNDGKPSESFRNTICTRSLSQHEAAWYPDFIGSIDGLFLTHTGDSIRDMGYQVVESKHGGKNIALQAFLATLSTKILHIGFRPTFSFPDGVKVVEYLKLWEHTDAQTSSTSGPTNAQISTPT